MKDYEFVKMNPDVGHMARAGINPIDALKTYEGKISSVHFKDLSEICAKNKPAVYGKGVLDTKGMLAELDRQGYKGFFIIEYETKFEDNLAEVKECVNYLRNH